MAHSGRRAGLILFALAALAASTAAAPPAPPTAGGLKFADGGGVARPLDGGAGFDFGTVSVLDHGLIDRRFVLHNAGPGPATIVFVRASRPFVRAGLGEGLPAAPEGAAPPPQTLAPGQDIPLRVTLDPSRLRPGLVHETVSIVMADAPPLTLDITGTLKAAATFSPPVLNFGPVLLGDTRPLRLTVTLDPRLIVGTPLRLAASDPGIQITPVTGGGGETNGPVRVYDVVLAKHSHLGRITGTVMLIPLGVPTDPRALDGSEAHVTGEVLGGVNAVPSAVAFGTVAAGTPLVRQVLLTGAGADPSAVRVSSGSRYLTVRLTPSAGAPGEARGLAVQVTLGANAPPGAIDTQVSLMNRNGEEYVLTASARVTPPGTAPAPPGVTVQDDPVPPRDGPGPRYTVTALNDLIPAGDVPGHVPFDATMINVRGQIIGTLTVNGDHKHAFLWDPSTGMRDLGVLPGFTDSRAEAINDRGDVAVTMRYQYGHPYLWADGRFQEVGLLGGRGALGSHVTVLGDVTGYADVNDQIYHAFVWRHGKTQDLGTLPGYPISRALSANDHGQVVGDVIDSLAEKGTLSTPSRAVLWQDSRPVLLESLGGNQDVASSINSRGQIAGTSGTGRKDEAGYFTRHAVVWENGRVRDLGALPITPLPNVGGPRSEAYDINDAGTVVGTASVQNGTGRACVWDHGQIAELNTLLPPALGWDLIIATHIDSRGRILALGTRVQFFDRTFHTVLLTPIPPPDVPAPVAAAPPPAPARPHPARVKPRANRPTRHRRR